MSLFISPIRPFLSLSVSALSLSRIWALSFFYLIKLWWLLLSLSVFIFTSISSSFDGFLHLQYFQTSFAPLGAQLIKNMGSQLFFKVDLQNHTIPRCLLWDIGTYVAQVRFGIRVWVRVRVRVQDSAIFEKGGCGCSENRRLKNNFIYIFNILLSIFFHIIQTYTKFNVSEM